MHPIHPPARDAETQTHLMLTQTLTASGGSLLTHTLSHSHTQTNNTCCSLSEGEEGFWLVQRMIKMEVEAH